MPACATEDVCFIVKLLLSTTTIVAGYGQLIEPFAQGPTMHELHEYSRLSFAAARMTTTGANALCFFATLLNLITFLL